MDHRPPASPPPLLPSPLALAPGGTRIPEPPPLVPSALQVVNSQASANSIARAGARSSGPGTV
ncbi:MAG TPA: hypothetical protein VGI39_31390 [Polyangiaceae bacterium]